MRYYEKENNAAKELKYIHQEEIKEYRGKLKILEYTIQNKKTENDVLGNQIKKLQQELETTQARLQVYEVMTYYY